MEELSKEENAIIDDTHPDVIIVIEGGKVTTIAALRAKEKIAIVDRDNGRVGIFEQDGMEDFIPEGAIPMPGKPKYRTRG